MWSLILVVVISEVPLGNLSSSSPVLNTREKNCGTVVTAYAGVGPYTLAAIGVSIVMISFLVLLAICRGGYKQTQQIVM